jgi:hypothetical protein
MVQPLKRARLPAVTSAHCFSNNSNTLKSLFLKELICVPPENDHAARTSVGSLYRIISDAPLGAQSSPVRSFIRLGRQLFLLCCPAIRMPPFCFGAVTGHPDSGHFSLFQTK